ncbi:hypothetical protein P9112_014133 [Eukaryota sp. TZLM1-RC]
MTSIYDHLLPCFLSEFSACHMNCFYHKPPLLAQFTDHRSSFINITLKHLLTSVIRSLKLKDPSITIYSSYSVFHSHLPLLSLSQRKTLCEIIFSTLSPFHPSSSPLDPHTPFFSPDSLHHLTHLTTTLLQQEEH